MVRNFFLTPLPLVFAFGLYSILSFKGIRDNKWAKIARFSTWLLLISTILVWTDSLYNKVEAGRTGHHAMLVLSVTYHAEKLLIERKYNEAELVLNQFNSQYKMLAHSNESLKDFIIKMKIPLYAQEKEEIEDMYKKDGK